MGTGVILVGSLKAMQPYFEMDSVHVILDKGDYFIKPSDIESGDLSAMAPTVVTGDGGEAILVANSEHSFFHIAGNNSTYDFGGSTITVYTSTYQYVSGNCTPLRFTGSYNTVKNLELIDDGDLESTGTNITNVIIDGANNLLTEFKLQSRGCTPYGYGELFGKGGVMILSTQKHCGVLIRGNYNTFSNSEVFHKAYGHCVFMQGAEYPTIDNCYIQSLVSTTEAIYAEKGSGSPADGADFLTYFGYHMSDNYNYTLALCEEGIRAYITGETIIDGVPYVTRAPVVSPTIKNCTIKDARGGVTLTHSSNAWVENCKAVGCGRGFAIPNNSTIINCSGDAQYGPLYGVDYQGSGYTNVDVTLVDQEGVDALTVVEPRSQWLSNPDEEFETCNGTAHIAYIEGTNHKIKFRDGRVNDTWQNSVKIKPSWATYPVSGISFAHIGLGGDDRNVGSLWLSDTSVEILDENGDGTGEYGTANPSETIYDDGSYLTNSYIANQTDWPVWIDSETSGCEIWSNATVIIESGATNNTIYISGSKSDYVIEYGTMDSSNIIHENYTWDIDSCF